jgi:WD40 repeat protein
VWPLDGRTTSLATLEHPDWVYSVAIEGDVIATGCQDRNVYTWSLASYARTRILAGHDGYVLTVRLMGGVLVSGGYNDKLVKVWRLDESGGECVATLQHETAVFGVVMLPSGSVVAVGDKAKGGALLVWPM